MAGWEGACNAWNSLRQRDQQVEFKVAMKRILVRVAFFLTLSAILNVAVAWACALWPTENWHVVVSMPDDEAHSLWRRRAPADWPSGPDEGGSVFDFGRVIRNAHLLDEAYSNDDFVGYVHTWDVLELVAGWPLPALRLDALHRTDGG